MFQIQQINFKISFNYLVIYMIRQLYKKLEQTFAEKYRRNQIKREYEGKPTIEGLIIGGVGIAASAIAASKQPEIYDPTREVMPSLQENQRNETGDNMLKVEVPKTQAFGGKPNDKKGKNDPYNAYGKAYKKYDDKTYGARASMQKLYMDFVEKLSQLGKF
jgi:hypothetical protein